jgi:hypothetical protein
MCNITLQDHRIPVTLKKTTLVLQSLTQETLLSSLQGILIKAPITYLYDLQNSIRIQSEYPVVHKIVLMTIE